MDCSNSIKLHWVTILLQSTHTRLGITWSLICHPILLNTTVFSTYHFMDAAVITFYVIVSRIKYDIDYDACAKNIKFPSHNERCVQAKVWPKEERINSLSIFHKVTVANCNKILSKRRQSQYSYMNNIKNLSAYAGRLQVTELYCTRESKVSNAFAD